MSTVGRLQRAVALLVVALLALVACGDAGDGGTIGSPSGPGAVPSSGTYEPVAGRVVVVGDSLTVGAEENLRELADLHGFTMDLSAQNGRQIPAGVEELRRLDAPSADLVMIALGTNDAAQPDFDRQVAATLIDEAMAAAGDAPVLWMNVWRDPRTPAGAKAAEFNEALVAAQGRHPNLTALDWASYVDDNPEIIAADGIHHTWEGYVARSRWMRDEIVSRLRWRSPAATAPGATTG
jgi:lysophospholipase L1-like esterase